MTNRFDYPAYRQALDDQVRARVQREAWDAVSLLADLIAGRVPVPDDGDDDDPVTDAILAIEEFMNWAQPGHDPFSAGSLTLLFFQTPPRVDVTPS